MDEELDLPLAVRRSRRENIPLPKRYQDVLPEPPAALPPLSLPQYTDSESTMTSSSQEILAAATANQVRSLPRVRKIWNSPRNIFGLFRQYFATHFPEHDPDENMASDLVLTTSLDSADEAKLYHPYPNQSSFLLGEWYWNDGVKKSTSSFTNLLKIIEHPGFQPEDVRGTNWRRINEQLGGRLDDLNGFEDNEENCWEDELPHGGWIESPITIKVPFHKRSLQPGQEPFFVGNLYHRKLVPLIKEKILRTSFHPHLHIEPYRLYWQPSGSSKPIRVHGELYQSDVFIDAHRELQESPREPGCELPRVIVGLMFASDGTHLTAFSDAKLSPVYLGIGNESKYRRSKPSCQAYEHVAYFEKVNIAPFSVF
jgi:hypothetical protein